MILLAAVIVGLIAGLTRAWIGKRNYRTPTLKWIGLVFVAFLPQFLAFILHPTREIIPDGWIPYILISSLILMLVFALANICKPGFYALTLGLACNFLVIALNGGMMPISPKTVLRNIPNPDPGMVELGTRLGTGKDVILAEADTKLWFLSDHLTSPAWLNYPVAFSVGDVIISIGAIWLLWSLGGPVNQREEKSHERI